MFGISSINSMLIFQGVDVILSSHVPLHVPRPPLCLTSAATLSISDPIRMEGAPSDTRGTRSKEKQKSSFEIKSDAFYRWMFNDLFAYIVWYLRKYDIMYVYLGEW